MSVYVLCVYVCMSVYMLCVCVCMSVYVYVWVCMCMYECVCVCMSVYVFCMYVGVHLRDDSGHLPAGIGAQLRHF
jgi:hypothetical protein